MLPTIDWQDDAIVMVDQRKLPTKEVYIRCSTANRVKGAFIGLLEGIIEALA